MRHQALLFIDWKRGWSLLHLGGFFDAGFLAAGFLAAFFAAGFLVAFLPLEAGFLSDVLASVGAAGFCGVLCWTVLGAAGF